MAYTPLPSVRTPPTRLIDQVNHLRSTLARDRIQVTDMSRAGSLETGIGTVTTDEANAARERRPVEIVRLEGRIVAREVECESNPSTRFKFFLDGTQKTMPICRVGLVPLVAALSAVGVLYRDGSGQPVLLGDLLRVNQTWIVPRDSGNPELDAMIWLLEETGGIIHDVDAAALGPAGDYGRSLAYAFELAGRIRGDQEQDVLNLWEQTVAPLHPDAWIAVDGRLRRNVRNAVGVVKDLQTQHLAGNEAVTLFDLPKGHRTTAFRYATATKDEDRDGEGEGRTMWYMRLWNPIGMDARHSLVRIEAPNSVTTSDEIDEISRWVLAERLPRATEDPRWPTLLYPISYLERILKRRLADITAGWPSA